MPVPLAISSDGVQRALLLLVAAWLIVGGIWLHRSRVEVSDAEITVFNVARTRVLKRDEVRAVVRPTLATRGSLLLVGPDHLRLTCLWLSPWFPSARLRMATELAARLGVPVVG